MKNKSTSVLFPAILAAAFIFIGCQSQEFTSAKVYIQSGNLEKAEEFFLQALTAEPENPEVPYMLAMEIYDKQNRYPEVKKYLEESLRRGPMFKAEIENYYKRIWSNSYNEGVKYFNAVIGNTATDRDEAVRQAIDKFSIAYLFNPTEVGTIIQMAKCYRILEEDPDKGLAIIDEGIGKVDDPSQLIYDKAAYYLIPMGRRDEAKAILQEYLVKYPENLDNILLLGGMYVEDEQYENAIQIFNNALVFYPMEKNLYFNLGLAYNKNGQLDEANMKFTQVLGFDPNDVEVLETVGSIYFKNEDYISAEIYFRQLYDLDSTNPHYMRILGDALNRQGRTDEGMDLYRQARELE